MRQIELVVTGSPCDIDFTDREMQTVEEAVRKGRTPCENFFKCQRKPCHCYRRYAKDMAVYILKSEQPLESAIETERRDFLDKAPDAEYLTHRDGHWVTVTGKSDVVDDVIAFAKIILDCQSSEEVPGHSKSER